MAGSGRRTRTGTYDGTFVIPVSNMYDEETMGLPLGRDSYIIHFLEISMVSQTITLINSFKIVRRYIKLA